MRWRFKPSSAGFCLALLLLMLTPLARAEVALSSANTSLRLDATILRNLGLELSGVEQTGTPAEPGAIAFRALAGQRVSFIGLGTDFEGFDALDLHHDGGFSIGVGDRVVSLSGFRLAQADPPYDMQLLDATGRRWFWIASSHGRFVGQELQIKNADILIAPAMAALLGRPDLNDSFVGVFEGTLALAQPLLQPRGVVECDPNFNFPPDVELIELSSISQGAYEPGGRVSVSPRAKLRNNGPGDVLWNYSIAPDSPTGQHPFLSLHFYTLVGGVLEQVGVSDLKHGFFATNGGCDCNGANVLFSGCTDTYGVSTNLNTYNLSPREELNAHTRSFVSNGSHFDGLPADDIRDHGGNSYHDAFEHRLVVAEADLTTPGAVFFVEVWYLAADDTNLFNSMGHRQVAPTFGGSTWSFPTVGSGLTLGSILDELVDPQNPGPAEMNEVHDTLEGRVQLVGVATDLGMGVHHYEYAFVNYDFERQIASFKISTDPALSVTNVGFGDGDDDPNNDWTAVLDPTGVTWTAPAGTGLDWARLVNFRFDVDASPTQTSATLDPLDPPAGAILMDTIGPITAVDDDAPTAAANTGSTLAEGATDTLTTTELRYTDTEQPAASITFTVTTGATNGQLELTGNPGVAITTFTQAQVDAGQVVYVHGGSNTTSDSFSFDVDDGQGNALTGESFGLTITAVDDDAPTMAANTGSTLAEGGTDTLTNTELHYADTEQPVANITYTVTTGATHGQLELTGNPGVAITSFTQAQVDAGQVVYVHGGSNTTSDSFSFDVDDGQGNALTGQSFGLTITATIPIPTSSFLTPWLVACALAAALALYRVSRTT